MKPQSHTSGPWTVDYTDDGLCIYAGELLIAEVHGSTELFEVQGLHKQTMEANASLIAAAPDLLAALERMIEHGDRRNLYYEHGEDAPSARRDRQGEGGVDAGAGEGVGHEREHHHHSHNSGQR
jgi:hypothetical protein